MLPTKKRKDYFSKIIDWEFLHERVDRSCAAWLNIRMRPIELTCYNLLGKRPIVEATPSQLRLPMG